MQKFGITVREVLEKTVIVEASNISEAMQKAEDAIAGLEVILSADDYQYREIVPCKNWKNGKVPVNESVSKYCQLDSRK